MSLFVLVSPSKTQDFSKPAPVVDGTRPRFLAEAGALIQQLRGFSVGQLENLQNLSPALADQTWRHYQAWTAGLGRATRPAAWAYSGTTFEGLAAPRWSAATCQRAQDRLAILSGLYGWLRPFDLIQPYRLEMAQHWPTGDRGVFSVRGFWKARLVAELTANGSPLLPETTTHLINLASTEYSAVLDLGRWRRSGRLIVTPVFEEASGRGWQSVSVFSKRARGLMASWILSSGLDQLTDLLDFQSAGYQYAPAASSPERPVFRRQKA